MQQKLSPEKLYLIPPLLFFLDGFIDFLLMMNGWKEFVIRASFCQTKSMTTVMLRRRNVGKVNEGGGEF